MEYCPTRDEVTEMFLSLLPEGLAWQSKDGAIAVEDSVLKSFWYGIAGPWTELEDAICAQFDELFVATTSDPAPFSEALSSNLGDGVFGDRDLWLADYGLPDDCDVSGASLDVLVAAAVGTEIDDYEALAAALGYDAQMRWLRGNDVEFPGVHSTLHVVIDSLSSASSALSSTSTFDTMIFDDIIFGDPEVVPLICVLDKMIPAHCAITYSVI